MPASFRLESFVAVPMSLSFCALFLTPLSPIFRRTSAAGGLSGLAPGPVALAAAVAGVALGAAMLA